MKTHRSTRAKVPKKPRPANREPFSPAAALESLHTEMVQLETFAHLAGEVATRLSPPDESGRAPKLRPALRARHQGRRRRDRRGPSRRRVDLGAIGAHRGPPVRSGFRRVGPLTR
jgi:hypothetical protein